MRIVTNIIDGETGESIPYATAIVYDYNGKKLAVSDVGDDKGEIVIDSVQLDKQDRVIRVTAAGYDENTFYPDEWGNDFKLYQKKENTLADVVVKSIKKKVIEPVKKHSQTITIVLAAASIVCITIWAVKSA